MIRIDKLAVVSAFALISTAALAQGMRTEKNMSLALANEAAAAAVEACAAKGYLVSAAVADRAGNEVIGAIGVGGAPGGHLDDQCAEAAIAKIKDRLN